MQTHTCTFSSRLHLVVMLLVLRRSYLTCASIRLTRMRKQRGKNAPKLTTHLYLCMLIKSGQTQKGPCGGHLRVVFMLLALHCHACGQFRSPPCLRRPRTMKRTHRGLPLGRSCMMRPRLGIPNCAKESPGIISRTSSRHNTVFQVNRNRKIPSSTIIPLLRISQFTSEPAASFHFRKYRIPKH